MDLRSSLPGAPVPEPTALSWRVSPPLAWVKIAAAVAFVLVAIIYQDDPTKATAAAVGALLVAVYAVRDLIAPVRLAADAEGVTVVAGYASRRRLPWSHIDRVRVDVRNRLGVRAELLEIDAGDSLHLFSTYDLNTPCAEVAESLHQLHSRSARA
jgi:hypothetical protein